MALDGGNRFLGVSGRGGAPLAAPVQAKLDALTAGWARVERSGTLLRLEPAGFGSLEGEAPLCMNSPGAFDTADGRLMGPEAVAAALTRRGASAAAGFVGPFACAWIDAASGSLRGATDALGIGQLFYAQSPHGAAVSNSASLLARLFDCGLDADALTAFALFGAFLDTDTPFSGVTKLAAGAAVDLSGGRALLRPGRSLPSNAAATVEGMAEALRESVTRLSDAAPEADLQLSGGLDSRLILAALPPDRRRRHRAVTIGGPGSADVKIARAIAERCGLRVRVVDTETAQDLDRDAFAALLGRAAEGFDGSANPIDKAALLLVERKLDDSGAWFNGQNGEALRGFFYPGQRLDAQPSEALARSLIAWRLETNDVADARLFEAEAYGARKARAEARAVERLVGLGGSWAEALDRFYVYERMQRWAGNGLDNLLNRRAYLCPFFEAGFVQGAFGLRPEQKSGAQAAFRLLHRLDPELASIPLDSGLRPASVVDAPLQARIARARQFAKKAGNRAKRMMFRRNKATLGSASTLQLWHRHKLYEQLPRDQLLSTGLFSPSMLEKVASGEWLPDRPTLGFILMVAEIGKQI